MEVFLCPPPPLINPLCILPGCNSELARYSVWFQEYLSTGRSSQWDHLSSVCCFGVLPTSSILNYFFRFVSIWTFLTAGIFSLLFLHPTWSRHSISSIGTQGIWLFVTWLLWVVGAGVIDGSLPALINHGDCKGIVHCLQVRLLFTVAVVER